MVWSTRKPTVNAVDAGKQLTTTRRRGAPVAASLLPRWEDMTDGLKKSEQEEEKELAEWAIWKTSPEEPKTDSEMERPLNPSPEKFNDYENRLFSFFTFSFLQEFITLV